jgi:hypothetical protein
VQDEEQDELEDKDVEEEDWKLTLQYTTLQRCV